MSDISLIYYFMLIIYNDGQYYYYYYIQFDPLVFECYNKLSEFLKTPTTETFLE